ncbi:MAG: CHAD domain-containing protein [Burkholderiales bacterium]|nr:CHAD domain-containing protein [Burkholderiales bacterium]
MIAILDHDSKWSADALLRAIVRSCLMQILPNTNEVAAGSIDEEHVHQLRVGLRRLRTAAHVLHDFCADLDPASEEPLAEAFRQLGRYRDVHNVLPEVEARLSAVGAPAARRVFNTGPVPDPRVTVCDPAFQASLRQLNELSLAESPRADRGGALDKPAAARKELCSRLTHLRTQMTHASKQFEAMEPSEQHRVRKRLKRLRYLIESIAPLFDKHEVQAYVAALQPALQALSLHRDEAVALEVFRARTQPDPRTWFAVGWLTAHQAQTAAACALALGKAVRRRPFWHK